MTTQEIAKRLYELVREGDYFTAIDELFHADAKALEPQLAEMGMAEVKGIEAIKKKVATMGQSVNTLLSREMSTPIVAANHIAFTNIVAAELKDGSTMSLSEICLYEVQDGKIISEQFFY